MSTDKPVEFPPLLPDEEIDRMAVRKPAPPAARPEPFAIVLQAYPRIAERLRELWGSAECDRYLAELLIDRRGSRQGFPPPVVSALLELSEVHQKRAGDPVPDIARLWDADRRGGR
jgi:hypothetical protein